MSFLLQCYYIIITMLGNADKYMKETKTNEEIMKKYFSYRFVRKRVSTKKL